MVYQAQFLENNNPLFSTDLEAMSLWGALRQAIHLRNQFVALGNEGRPYKDDDGMWIHRVRPKAIEVRIFTMNGRPRCTSE